MYNYRPKDSAEAGKEVGHDTARPSCSAFVRPCINDEQSLLANLIRRLAINGPARAQTFQKSSLVASGHENDSSWRLEPLLLMPSRLHQACILNRARCAIRTLDLYSHRERPRGWEVAAALETTI